MTGGMPPSKEQRRRGARGPAGGPPAGQRTNPAGSGTFGRWLPALALAFLTAVFFWKLISPLSGSRNWLWEDFLFQNYPYRVFAATSLVRGYFPFWNPYVFGGQPFFADIQTAVLYPFNLMQALFTGPDSLNPLLVELVEILHYFLAGWFTYRFLRLADTAVEAATLGGIAFAFSGFMATHAIHMNFIYVFVWLPLVLELFERSLAGGRFRYAVGCAAVLALSTMGGYPQYSLYIYYVLGLYWLVFEVFGRRAGEWTPAAALRRLGLLLFITIGALGLNLFAYLPAAELARYTPRSEMTYEASVEHSLAPWLLVKLAVPKFFGVQYPENNSYWAGGYSAFWETCLFVGTLPLALALFSLKKVRANRHVAFAALLAVVGLWLALGRYGLLYRLFFDFAPGFDRFRIPGRFASFVSFALALLAAHGLSEVSQFKERLPVGFTRSGLFYVSLSLVAVIAALWIFTGTPLATGNLANHEINAAAAAACRVSFFWALAALAAAWLIFRFRRRTGGFSFAGAAACLLVFAELYWFGAPFMTGTLSPDQLYQDSPLVRFLQEEGKKELFRVNSRSLEDPGIMLLGRNQGSLHRIFLIEGYNPLQLERRLLEVEKDRRFDLLNVKYKIQVDYQKRSMSLAPHESYLPRAFFVDRWRVIGDGPEIIRTLNSPDFDYRHEVILEQDPGIDTPPVDTHIEADIEVTKYTQNEIVVRADCRSAGILVLSEWHYPAWKAWLDGMPVPVLRADHALRAVALEAGSHEVRFAYSSATFQAGALASVLTALAIIAAAGPAARRGRF